MNYETEKKNSPLLLEHKISNEVMQRLFLFGVLIIDVIYCALSERKPQGAIRSGSML